MGDIGIPGVSSRHNTQKLIQDLLNLERQKLTRLESEKTEFQEMRTLWQGMSRRMQTLRDAARSLYGFESPFLNKVGESNQAQAVTVSPARTASEGQWRVHVLQLATPDRFMSRDLPLDATAPAGEYRFKVGDREVSVPFRGGRLSSLVEAINQRGRDLLMASLIRTTGESQVMTIGSLKTGSAHRLEFLGAARDWSVEAGFLRPTTATDRRVELTQNSARVQSPPNTVSFTEVGAVLAPGARLSVPAIAEPRPGLVLELTVRAESVPPDEIPIGPPGLQLPQPGSVEFQDVRIRNNPMRTDFPHFEPPPPVAPVIDPKVGRAVGASASAAMPDFPLTPGVTTLRVPLDGLGGLQSLEFENRNTGLRFTVSDVKVIDPNARGDLEPANAQSTARDAVFEIDGVRVTRGSNTVDDVIAGLTINILETTPAPATVKVTPDYDSIKDGLIGFVGHYNRFLLDLLVVTSRNETIIDEATYLTDPEREELRKNMGRLQGDTALNQLRSSLQRILMESYPTGQPTMTLLHQAGISTNATISADGSTPEASRLRGYLEVNETKLDQALRENLPAVRNLFGMDTNGDLVNDTGAAWRMEEHLRPHVQTGGFIPLRVTTLDGNIARQDREIRDFNNYLTRYEQDLRRRFGQMEGALNRMEETGRAIDNFSRQNSGGR